MEKHIMQNSAQIVQSRSAFGDCGSSCRGFDPRYPPQRNHKGKRGRTEKTGTVRGTVGRFAGVQVLALLALLLAGCGGPADVGEGYTGMLCGYVSNASGPIAPRVYPGGWCTMVTVQSPSSGLLTVGDAAEACEVEETGQRCIVVAPDQTFRAWTELWQRHENVMWLSDPVACGTTCPD